MPISVNFLGALSTSEAAATYLKLDASNDPVTGELEIDPTTDTVAVKAQKHIVVKAGQSIYMDGA